MGCRRFSKSCWPSFTQHVTSPYLGDLNWKSFSIGSSNLGAITEVLHIVRLRLANECLVLNNVDVAALFVTPINHSKIKSWFTTRYCSLTLLPMIISKKELRGR
jgi:hypothetical protein